MIAIETHNLTVSYGDKPVVWEVDFQLPAGEISGIIGPNGSGKTSLIKGILGLEKPASGWVKILGKEGKEALKQVAYIPQKESIDWDFPISVFELVLMGRYQGDRWFFRYSKEDKKIAQQALEKCDILHLAERQISELSGGQQQRAFIARAMAQQAEVYIMDEPFVGIDMASEKAILNLISELKAAGKSIIIVHHDLYTVASYFDNVVLMNTRMVKYGKVNEVLTPEYIQETYGGKLDILSRVVDQIKERGFPIREKGAEKK